MARNALRLGIVLFVMSAGLGLIFLAPEEPANTEGRYVGRETGLRVPRFVSLKADEANVRRGPSLEYGIKWIFSRPDIPLEVMAEFDNWRKIRDSDGATGWIHSALLGPTRTAWVSPWDRARAFALRAGPQNEAPTLATLEPRVLVRVDQCDGAWCSVTAGSFDGYIRQDNLWGVYPQEVIYDHSIL